MNYPYKKAPSVVVARMARSGFAASGKPRIARGSSSPQKASVPFGDPKGLSAKLTGGEMINTERPKPVPRLRDGFSSFFTPRRRG